MELGNLGFDWITLVPVYGDNRSLPEEERLSVKIRKMNAIDVLGISDDVDVLYKWRDSRLSSELKDPEQASKILAFPVSVLQVFKQFTDHTKDFRNFKIDGEDITNPVTVFLRLPVSINPDDQSLIGEVSNAIANTASLYGEALKNFARQCGGL